PEGPGRPALADGRRAGRAAGPTPVPEDEDDGGAADHQADEPDQEDGRDRARDHLEPRGRPRSGRAAPQALPQLGPELRPGAGAGERLPELALQLVQAGLVRLAHLVVSGIAARSAFSARWYNILAASSLHPSRTPTSWKERPDWRSPIASRWRSGSLATASRTSR